MINKPAFNGSSRKHRCFSVGNPEHQSGAVLAISLIMLLLLSVIGITATHVTGLEEKMSGNSKDQMMAFQAAETALLQAETTIAGLPPYIVNSSVNNAAGLYMTDKTKEPDASSSYWQSIDWISSTAPVARYHSEVTQPLVGIVNLPTYTIEQLPDSLGGDDNLEAAMPVAESTSLSWYRITARGTGNNDTAVVMLQSTYSR
jgi:type IV pilus assembly protein PilX